MERHQAGQEEKLVEVRVETNSLEDTCGSPADRRGSFKCMVLLATVMGLVTVALVAAFILLFFMFTPSCNQEGPPLNDTAKVNMTCKLKKSNEQGTYDIFIAEKAAVYLIYGWVTFPDNTSKKCTVKTTRNGQSRLHLTKTEAKTEMFFFDKVRMSDTSKMIIELNSTFTDSSFHIYEL